MRELNAKAQEEFDILLEHDKELAKILDDIDTDHQTIEENNAFKRLYMELLRKDGNLVIPKQMRLTLVQGILIEYVSRHLNIPSTTLIRSLIDDRLKTVLRKKDCKKFLD